MGYYQNHHNELTTKGTTERIVPTIYHANSFGNSLRVKHSVKIRNYPLEGGKFKVVAKIRKKSNHRMIGKKLEPYYDQLVENGCVEYIIDCYRKAWYFKKKVERLNAIATIEKININYKVIATLNN